MAYLKSTIIKGRKMDFPIYIPDATRGVVRGLDAKDLKEARIEGVVANTYHLMAEPGTKVVEKYCGIKSFMGWDGFVATDSGGWQIFSMLLKNPALGEITDEGVKFFVGSRGNKKKYIFTPEISIQVQFKLNPDIVICLDAFTPPNASFKENGASVKRTIEWAKRCKEEFVKQCKTRNLSKENIPIILAPIQGGWDRKLRAICAKELIDIGFDAYGLGGWLIKEDGKMDIEFSNFVGSLVPDDKIRFALGAGLPKDVVNCVKGGWHIFDCVLPTRDARHGKIYIFNKDPNTVNVLNDNNVFGHFYIDKEKNAEDTKPISEYCQCFACLNYSVGYLRHLFKIQDNLGLRLATIHNLFTYSKTIEILRKI
jgi:queuine tRNA-ribosyltransferase